jgi:hypothetical protein
MLWRIEHIVTDTAPQPSGHYSQATAWGELLEHWSTFKRAQIR